MPEPAFNKSLKRFIVIRESAGAEQEEDIPD
jgi:hypothetical protein